MAPARRVLQQIPWKDAARIDANVIRFAERGEGNAYRLPADGASIIRLAVGDYRVRMMADADARVLWIMMIYRLDR